MTTSLAPAGSVPAINVAIVWAYLKTHSKGGYRRSGALAIRAQPVWTGDTELVVDDDIRAAIRPCASALAVREALLNARENEWLVILTDRDDEDLGTGITTHLVQGRVLNPNPWEAVADQFSANQRERPLEPHLIAEGRSVAEALLAHAPPEGWPPVRGGVLTRDAAFEALAGRVLGLPAAQLDPLGLLEWSADPHRNAGLTRLAPEVADKTLSWLAARTGDVGAATVQAARAGALADAVAFAVLAGLLDDPALSAVIRAEARGHISARLGGPLPGNGVGRGWAADARTVLERLLDTDSGLAHARTLLDRAETLLTGVGPVAAELATRSDLLPAGLSRRRHAFAEAIHAASQRPDRSHLDAAEAAFAELAAHLLAEHDPSERVQLEQRDRMALRLVRWLVTGSPSTDTLGAAVNRHVTVDGWVDRARANVWAGVVDPHAANAYRALYEAVTARRVAHDEQFASLVAPHFARPADTGSFLHQEDVLRVAVLPAVSPACPVLVVLVDGMSMAVATELAAHVADMGWVELVPDGRDSRLPALTLAPSLTEVCRTSFFAGAPTRGEQPQEDAGFAALSRSRELRTALFHKADLERSESGSALAAPVAAALEDRSVGLVGVVLNTVDETLRDLGPAHQPWTVDRITHLRQLLAAAWTAGRAVVVTADHGHVVERRTGDPRAVPDATSARSRLAPSRPSATTPAVLVTAADRPAAGEGEVLLRGRRVVAPGNEIILPWREEVRYTALKAGYHGGASPAEMVVPVLMFAHPGQSIRNWREAPPQSPIWWLRAAPSSAQSPVAAASTPIPGKTARRPVSAPPPRGRDTSASPREHVQESTLFDLAETAPLAAGAPTLGVPTTAPESAQRLVDEVTATTLFASQRKRLGRQPIDDAQIGAAMRVLIEAGLAGASYPVLATALRQPEYRTRGLIVTLQRLLNIEGYEVVSVDPDGVTVILNERLLREQFELEPAR